MKTISLLLFALLFTVTEASVAAPKGIRCNSAGNGNCPAPPAPPAPPAHPGAPMPPEAAWAPEAPEPPALPEPGFAPLAPLPPMPSMALAPPAPPAPPPLPKIPAGAHAACASKAQGTEMDYKVRPGAVMHGTCVLKKGKMLFDLDSYTIKN